ncbi:MAG: hypothetical protein JSW60_07585 [Thermoplasmatales archaeon]|nr:MAG: hypothetical protein JSW60_07585 [Thermoplasmatales archaeon]
MKKKIVVISVCALLIATALPVVATQNVEENEAPSCGPATTTVSSEMAKVLFQNDINGINERAVPFYGYCTWDPSSTLVPGPVSFNPTTPGTITQIASTSSTEFISGGTWAVGKWYGCEFALGVGQPLIWTIHPIIGEMTQVGSYDPDGTNLSFNGLAYDPTTNIMYGCSSTDLYKVNMTTGASSWVGNFGITGGIMIAIAFDGSGNLYGTELITDSLYSIDPTNGVATPIGTGLGININYAQDMAFDLDTGILYLSAYTIAPIKEGALYTCNTDTGVATKVETFQGAAEITGFAIPYCGVLQIVPSSIKGGILKIGQSKIQFTIANTGGLPCIDVAVTIACKRGLIFVLGKISVIDSISPGGTFTVTSPRIIGIGLRTQLTITANETSCGSTDTQTKKALVFGPLWSC